MDDYEKMELEFYLKGFSNKDKIIETIDALFLKEYRKFRKLSYEKQQLILDGLIAINETVVT